MLGGKGLDLLLGEECEYLEIFLSIGIAYIEPELIEFIGGGVFGVKPDIAALCLTEFSSVSLCDEGTGEGKYLSAEFAADELAAGGDIAPLVATAELKLAVLVLIEMEEVESLKKLVCEFGEGESVAGLSVETLLHGVFGHHVVDGDMLSYLTGEVEEADVLHPVVVVHEFGSVGSIALEIEEAAKLFFDSLLVMTQCGFVEKVALGRFAGGVADHTGGAAHEGDGFMTATLEMTQHHHSAEMADMEAVGGGVDTEVSGSHLFLKLLVGAGHHGVDHATPGEFVYEIHIIS